jgi:hypothetical protein
LGLIGGGALRNFPGMDNSKPAGEAIFISHGFTVINSTNGKLECHQGPTIIGSLTSGNVRDMLKGLAALGMEFANKSELSTDPTSPDDKMPRDAAE